MKNCKNQILICRSSLPEVLLGKGALKKGAQQKYRRTPMPKYDFNKVTEQLY